MKRKFNYLLLALILISSLVLVACNAETDDPGSDDETDGDVTEPTDTTGDEETEPESVGELPEAVEETALDTMEAITGDLFLDPANATGDASSMISGYIYETLVVSENGETKPGLAREWQVSEDGLDYIFILRADVTFHDGSLMDSDVVLANFERWHDPASPLRGSGAYAAWEKAFLGFKGDLNDDGSPKSTVDGVEKVNNLTLIVHLHRQDPDFLTKLSGIAFSIVSTEALSSQGDAFGMDASVAGTGAYMLTEWTSDSLTLMPNAAYWGTAPDKGLEFPIE